MCDFSGKLIAWMDGELTASEGAAVQEHLESCAACQNSVASYRRASDSFAAYCEAATASVAEARTRLRARGWGWAAAAAAAVALLFFVPKHVTKSRAPVEKNVAANQSTPGSLVPALAPPALAPIAPASVGEVHSSAAPAAERGPRNVAAYPHRANRERILTASVPVRSEASPATAPAIEIAFSSDSIFPEGAMPAGVSYVAQVTLAADGTAEQIRLQPRLVEFQERKVRP